MSKHEELLEQVRAFIRKNKTAKALELLSKEQFSSLDKQLIILSGEFSKIKEDQILGSIDDDVAQRRINAVNAKILELSDQIAHQGGRSHEVATVGQAKNDSKKYLLLAAGFVPLLLVAFFAISAYNTKQAAKLTVEKERQDSIYQAKVEKIRLDSIALVKYQQRIDSIERAIVI